MYILWNFQRELKMNFAINSTNMNKYKLIINKIFIELYFVNYNLNIKKFI